MVLIDLFVRAHHELIILSDADVVEVLGVGVIADRSIIHGGGSVWLHDDGAILLLLAVR